MGNFNLLHFMPNIEVIQWQELMSMSDAGSRIVAVRDEANNLCPVLFPHTYDSVRAPMRNHPRAMAQH